MLERAALAADNGLQSAARAQKKVDVKFSGGRLDALNKSLRELASLPILPALNIGQRQDAFSGSGANARYQRVLYWPRAYMLISYPLRLSRARNELA